MDKKDTIRPQNLRLRRVVVRCHTDPNDEGSSGPIIVETITVQPMSVEEELRRTDFSDFWDSPIIHTNSDNEPEHKSEDEDDEDKYEVEGENKQDAKVKHDNEEEEEEEETEIVPSEELVNAMRVMLLLHSARRRRRSSSRESQNPCKDKKDIDKKKKKTKVCGFCGSGGVSSYCVGCKKVYYCDKRCQMKDWSLHKKDCVQTRTPLKKKRTCDLCHRVGQLQKLKLCGGCEKVRYCDRLCQKIDWKRHKPQCHLKTHTSEEDSE